MHFLKCAPLRPQNFSKNASFFGWFFFKFDFKYLSFQCLFSAIVAMFMLNSEEMLSEFHNNLQKMYKIWRNAVCYQMLRTFPQTKELIIANIQMY